MVDTHCHILPDVDDGSDSLQTSMMMAAMAADDGVTDIIATPHMLWDRKFRKSNWEPIISAWLLFNETLRQSRIPIKCHLGAEVLCVEPAEELLSRGLFPCIEGTHYALIEFYFDERPDEIKRRLEAIRQTGIQPIIAHPERYFAVQNDLTLADKWRKEGYYLQINGGSLTGQFGKKAKRVAERMLKRQLVSLVATDAHNTQDRVPLLSSAASVIAKKSGKDYSNVLTMINPERLLNDAPFISEKQSYKSSHFRG